MVAFYLSSHENALQYQMDRGTDELSSIPSLHWSGRIILSPGARIDTILPFSSQSSSILNLPSPTQLLTCIPHPTSSVKLVLTCWLSFSYIQFLASIQCPSILGFHPMSISDLNPSLDIINVTCLHQDTTDLILLLQSPTPTPPSESPFSHHKTKRFFVPFGTNL